ncbi:hypothetical protein D3C73_916880 [compost metagenome]
MWHNSTTILCCPDNITLVAKVAGKLNAVLSAPVTDLLRISIAEHFGNTLPVVMPDLRGRLTMVKKIRKRIPDFIPVSFSKGLGQKLRPCDPGHLRCMKPLLKTANARFIRENAGHRMPKLFSNGFFIAFIRRFNKYSGRFGVHRVWICVPMAPLVRRSDLLAHN